MRIFFALSLLLLALAGGVAGDPYQECLASLALPSANGRAAYCLARLSGRSVEGRKARLELERLVATQPDNAYWTFALGLALDREKGCEVSLPMLRRAAALFAATGDVEEFEVRNNLAGCLDRSGKLDEAEQEVSEMLRLAQQTGKRSLLARTQLRQAQVALSAGELRNAENALAAISEQDFEYFSQQSSLLVQKGRLNLALGRVPEALRHYEALARMAEETGNGVLAARAAYDQAVARVSLDPSADNRREAHKAAKTALELSRRCGDQGVLIPSLLLFGRLERDPALLEECGLLAEEAGDAANFTACRFAAAALLAGAEPARADRLLDEGLAAGGAAEDPFVLLQPWGDQMQAFFALRGRQEALAAAEGLLQRVERLRQAETRPERRAELFGVWRRLPSWLAGQLLQSGDPAEMAAAFQMLEAARARELREALALQRDLPREKGLQELASSLPSDRALLTFHLGNDLDMFGNPGDHAAVFVTTKRGTIVVPLPDRTRLADALGLWLGTIESRQDEEPLARALGKLLWSRIAPKLPAEVRRLILIPDADLYRLPWALLRDEQGTILAESYEISLAPSATLALAKEAPPRAGGGLVFADPAFAGDTWPRLPQARREGKEIVGLLGGLLLADTDASKVALERSDLANYAVLHFAAHAVLDAELPEHSALLLAARGGDAGRLETREIARLPLHGQLVTLASCRSARGRILPGEGPMSLGRAFLEAGAPAVLGSLWELRDDEAAAFFARFYHHLARGERASTALALTQRELAEAGAPAAAWAGVALLGDGNFLLVARPPTRWRDKAAALLLLPLLTLAAYFYFRR